MYVHFFVTQLVFERERKREMEREKEKVQVKDSESDATERDMDSLNEPSAYGNTLMLNLVKMKMTVPVKHKNVRRMSKKN